MAARAAGIQAIDGPYLGIRDDDGFRAGAAHARALGFDGKWAIHPAQVDALREAFTPTEEEVARRARGARRARARRRRRGAGAVARDGQMLDEALGAVGAAGARARRRRAMSVARRHLAVAAPWFEDLAGRDRVRRGAPALTLTEGHAALHQAIAGDRLRLALDRTLAAAPSAPARRSRTPAWCGTSRSASRRWPPAAWSRTSSTAGCCCAARCALGDTLRTTTEVVALRENRVKAGRRPTGLALLRIRTVDQDERPVLDFTRCAMLPLRDDPTGDAGRRGRRRRPTSTPSALHAAAAGLDLAALPRRRARPALRRRRRTAGRSRSRAATSSTRAPELARLTLNVAMAHHDAGSTADGRRLVYGGHTIGIAAGAGDARAARPRDDPRLARLRPPRAGVRGRHAALADRARAARAAAGRRRAAAPALARDRRARRTAARTPTCSTGASSAVLA